MIWENGLLIAPQKPQDRWEPPKQIVESFFSILALERYDERIELLLDHAIMLFSEKNPIVIAGKRIYEDIMGFEFV